MTDERDSENGMGAHLSAVKVLIYCYHLVIGSK